MEEEITLIEHAGNCYNNMEYMVEMARVGTLTIEGEFTFAECIADGIEQIWILCVELDAYADLVDGIEPNE